MPDTMASGNYSRHANIPIPTYEEATSSRPASSASRRGPEEISDDAERQGLLRQTDDPTRGQSNYEPPAVESLRSSLDSIDGMARDSDDGLRREIQQMEIEEPHDDYGSRRSLLTHRFSKHLSSFTSSFSSLLLPSFRRYVPSIRWPSINFEAFEHNRVAIFGRLFGAFLIISVLYILIASDILTFRKSRMSMGLIYDPESIRMYIQSHMNEHRTMQEYLQHVTSFPHMAGTEGNYVLAEWVAELFKAGELEDVRLERFDVYLNYPRKDGRRVAVVEPEKEKWEAKIEEDREETDVFHGHSKSGDVTGPLVYANFGSKDDFRRLKDQGISVDGAVVLVRYYGTQGDRALKVRAAELAGAKGCIIYSDPSQDGFVKGPPFPDGRFMPPDGVQRGAVSLMSWIVGDVLSPGWPSTPDNKKRLTPADSAGLNQIPSIPISWNDAKVLLAKLQGHGKRMTREWKGAPGVEYWTGDAHSPKVNLVNQQDEEVYQPIYNVLGRYTGWEQPDKKIIVGNHRDAWCLGAADPGSGTAVMLEVVRIFGELRRLGWRPLRTIEFASWDGEEYNLIGSTEHVESREEELRRDGYAYLNVDVGVTGADFHAAASPMFERALMHALSRTSDPTSNRTIRDIWKHTGRGLEGLGAGSDFVAFQDIVGTSSIDMFFDGPEFPYHSCYDNMEWMRRFGDPTDFRYHKVLGEILALLTFELADHPLLQFDLQAYARHLRKYVDELDTFVDSRIKVAPSGAHLDLSPLRHAVDVLAHEARGFHVWDTAWHDYVLRSDGFESSTMGQHRRHRNDKLAQFETDLLDLHGLANRTQFKHVIFAPQLWSGYEPGYFPAVRDVLDADSVDAIDWGRAQAEVAKIAAKIEHAAHALNL